MANFLPFNSINADRAVKAEDWAWYFSTFISNGVFPQPSDGLQVVQHEDMTIAVKAGYGFINGYAFKNDSSHLIEIDIADGVLSRIDRVVLRWDLSDRVMEIAVLKGTPSANPEPVALTRQADRYELALADVLVSRGATSITQADITDRRFNTDLCGIVTGVIQQIDPSAITAQFDAFVAEYEARVLAYEQEFNDDMEAWEAVQYAAFNEWIQSLQEILDEEVAGHLQNEIEEAFARLNQLEHMTMHNDFSAPILLGYDDETPILLGDGNGQAIIATWQYAYN